MLSKWILEYVLDCIGQMGNIYTLLTWLVGDSKPSTQIYKFEIYVELRRNVGSYMSKMAYSVDPIPWEIGLK